MKVYFQEEEEPENIRTHPWQGGAGTYFDFKIEPEKIRTSLEDFTLWDRFPAIERFYKLVEWLNGPDSRLESNDCAFQRSTSK